LKTGELYADLLLPNGSRRYAIEAPKESLVSLVFQTNTEGAGLEVEAEGQVNRTRVDVAWLPPPYIYYASNRSEVRFLITNPRPDIVNYTFYVDISEPLGENCSRILPLEASYAAFHVDLRRDDRVLLKVGSTNHSGLEIWVFVLYYEILPETTYKLCMYGRSLYKTLYFTADLGGRYYIIVVSAEGEGELYVSRSTYSPPWNQEWFWLTVPFAFFIVAISLTDVGRIRRLEKVPLFALISCYSWFLTIGLSVSVAGSFGYGTLIHVPLFYLLVFTYGLSHALQIYATYLYRKMTSGNCPYCGKEVNLQEVNYCCDRIVENVSGAWFLLPLSLGLLFFIVSQIILGWVFPLPLSRSLWLGGCGSLIGGIIAWWINRNVYPMKSWRQNPKRYSIPDHIRFVPIGLLITGILFSFLSPLLVGLIVEAFLMQHIELFPEAPVPWLRTRIAPLTLSVHAILGSAILAMVSGLFVAYRIRRILARNISEKQDHSISIGLNGSAKRYV